MWTLRYEPDTDERAILAVARRHRDADDIAQLAMLYLLQAAEPRPCTRGERISYVTGIARRAALRHLRTKGMWGRFSGDADADVPVTDAHSIDWHDLLSALPWRERTVIDLHYRVGLSQREIREAMHVGRETIDKTLSRARARLARVLQEHRAHSCKGSRSGPGARCERKGPRCVAVAPLTVNAPPPAP